LLFPHIVVQGSGVGLGEVVPCIPHSLL
jgi:hypothetical protein